VVFISADIQAKEDAERQISPSILNVCLAIDCSSSMSGEKFEKAKEAAVARAFRSAL
jgi:uncharacterized protein with von Willebrand factor type A (vWA) domain